MRFRKLPPEEQPTLPGEFEPPPPECDVTRGKHTIATIQSYSTIKYFPTEAYEPWCTSCGVKGDQLSKSADV